MCRAGPSGVGPGGCAGPGLCQGGAASWYRGSDGGGVGLPGGLAAGRAGRRAFPGQSAGHMGLGRRGRAGGWAAGGAGRGAKRGAFRAGRVAGGRGRAGAAGVPGRGGREPGGG